MRATPRSRGRLAAGLLLAAILFPAGADAQRLDLARAGAVPDTAAVPGPWGGAPGEADERRSGFVAFGLAYLFPGAGHFYAGESWRGATILGLVGGGFMYAMAAPEAQTAPAGVALSLGTYLWSMIDAPLAARRHNRRLERRSAPHQ